MQKADVCKAAALTALLIFDTAIKDITQKRNVTLALLKMK